MKAAGLACLLIFCAAAQPSGVRLPAFTREVLPNGAVLCLMPKQDAPLFSLRIEFRGGAESDPPQLAGLSSVMAGLLGRGTKTRTAARFASDVDYLGADFQSYVTPQATIVAVDVLPSHAIEAIKLVSDAVLHPAFQQMEVRRQLRRSIENARSRKDSPDDAIWQYFRSFFFQAPHPYGRPFRGDELTLGRIGRLDLQRQFARICVGRNLIVTAVGPFRRAPMAKVLRSAFASLPAGRRYRWQYAAPPPAAASPRFLLVDKPDVTQTQFVIGFPGIGRTNPDRIPLWLVNNILGGRFTSLLNERLRVETGLTYGAYSDLQEDRLPGAITLYSYAATGDTKRAIDLAFDVLRDFAREGVTADQLSTAKRYIEAGYPPDNLQTAAQLADLLADLELYGLGRRDIDDLFARLDRVTLGDDNRVLRKYLSGKNPVLVMIGQARRIRSELDGYASDITEVSIDRPGFPRPAGILRADARPPSAPGHRSSRRRTPR